MNYTELSLKELRKVSLLAARKIKSENDIDLLIYVARAGYPLAVYMNEILQVPMLGIHAQRRGTAVKSVLGPWLSYMPLWIRNQLIRTEMLLKIHDRMRDRDIEVPDTIYELMKQEIREILLVDDSVDTGNTIKECYNKLQSLFPEARIHSYSLNVWSKSEAVFHTDYYSYRDTVIRAPMSKDSKEYKAFCRMYEEGQKHEGA